MDIDYTWLQCSASAYTEGNKRGFSWGIVRYGYGPIFNRVVASLDHSKQNVVMLHNPFGRTFRYIPDSSTLSIDYEEWFRTDREVIDQNGSPVMVREMSGGVWKTIKMEFDAELRLRASDHRSIADDFWENIQILRAAAEVIVYIGCPHNTNRMVKFLEAKRYGSWNWAFWRCTENAIERHCSVAFDNCASLATYPKEASAIRDIDEVCKMFGQRAWIESTTEYGSLLHDQLPMIVTEDVLIGNRHIFPQHPAAVGRFPVVSGPDWYKNPVVGLFNNGDWVNRKDEAQGRIDYLGEHGISSMLPFQMREWIR